MTAWESLPMKSWRKALSLSIVAVLALGVATSPAAMSADEQPAYDGSNLSADNNIRVFSMIDDGGSMHTNIWDQNLYWCTSTKDPKCDFYGADAAARGYVAESVLAPCESATSEDCIARVEIKRNDGSYADLSFEGFIPDAVYEKHIPADPALNFPAGGAPSVWVEKIDGVVQPKKYLVGFDYNTNFDPVRRRFEIVDIRFNIRPFKEIPGEQWNSLWFGNGKSGLLYNFDPGVSMRATVHMTTAATGWFKARLKSPDISINKLSSTNNVVTISGEPVEVPTFVYTKPRADLDEQEKYWEKFWGFNKGIATAGAGNPRVFEFLNYMRPKVNDIAAQSTTQWSFNSTPWESRNPCLYDSTQLMGIVTTNAMAYKGGTPEFVDGYLNYTVSGMHYKADGKTPVIGTYDLLLRSSAARCLYGFTNAPISATVSITGGDGDQNVATTVLNEKDGWIRLSAYGFTFSEKTIKMKLTQEAPKKEEVAPAPSPTASPKKTTVSCIKGKMTKKVTAVSPTCPKGYVKK